MAQTTQTTQPSRTTGTAGRLRVDPVACDGRGLCAELLPELITPDDWGYPIVAPEPIPASLEKHVQRAIAACPMLALHVR